MFEMMKIILFYFGLGVLIIFPLIWLIGFVIKSDKFNEIKNRLRIVLTVIVAIFLYAYSEFGTIKPSKGAVVYMMKKWYPDTTNHTVAITESKIETDTYKAYVSFNFKDGKTTCHSEITIRPSGEKNNYNYSTNGYSCN